jgi:hypothetical protein
VTGRSPGASGLTDSGPAGRHPTQGEEVAIQSYVNGDGDLEGAHSLWCAVWVTVDDPCNCQDQT